MTATSLGRSYEQRIAALQAANTVRSKRADLKVELHRGDRKVVADLLLSPPSWAETMRVWDVLFALPRWGAVKVNKHLKRCDISPRKTLGGLSERQRRELRGSFGDDRNPTPVVVEGLVSDKAPPSEPSAGTIVQELGGVLVELNAAEEAFRADINSENFMRFMRARQAYFILAKEADRLVALGLAVGWSRK